MPYVASASNDSTHTMPCAEENTRKEEANERRKVSQEENERKILQLHKVNRATQDSISHRGRLL
jgi:hypothetical protein